MTRSNASPFKLREHPEITVGESLTYQYRNWAPYLPPVQTTRRPSRLGGQATVGLSQIRARHLRRTGIHNEDPRHQRPRGNVIRPKGAEMINSQLPCSHRRGDAWGFRGPQRPRLRGKGNAKPDRNLQSPSLCWLDRVSPFSAKCWILPNAVRGNSSVKKISRGTLKRASCEPACAISASASTRTPGRLIT